MKSPRFAPLTGVAFVVLLIIGFIPVGGNTPQLDDSASKITSFYADNQGREVAAIIVVAIAALFLALFSVPLRNYLRDTGDGSGFCPTVAPVAGPVAVSGLLLAGRSH